MTRDGLLDMLACRPATNVAVQLGAPTMRLAVLGVAYDVDADLLLVITEPIPGVTPSRGGYRPHHGAED